MRLALAQLNFTNPYYLSTGTEDSAHDIEQHLETLVRTLKGSIRIPLAVKLSPFYTALANVAARLNAAGADGLVLFNRFLSVRNFSSGRKKSATAGEPRVSQVADAGRSAVWRGVESNLRPQTTST